MNPERTVSNFVIFRWFVLGLVVAGASFWFAAWRKGGQESRSRSSTNAPLLLAAGTKPAPAVVAPSAPASTTPWLAAKRLPASAFSWFQEHPFPAALTNGACEWTAENGKDTNVIRQLAHNELEYQRMVDENPRIFRRQLVYLQQTAAAVFEAAKLTGHPVERLTLPGLDGQELQWQIVQREGNGSSRQGMFSGHLVGKLDSTVSFAFQDGREAFSVIAPKENLYVVGEPREDAQVIVKAIDPRTYGAGPAEPSGDDFIQTAAANK